MSVSVQARAAQGRLRKDDIDSRMLKSLADLPSDLGLEAVEKFGMASLETVRSKTGFMVRTPPPAAGGPNTAACLSRHRFQLVQ